MKKYPFFIIIVTMLFVGQAKASGLQPNMGDDFPNKEMKEFRTVVGLLNVEIDNFVTKNKMKKEEAWFDQYKIIPYLHNISLYMENGVKLFEDVEANYKSEDKMSQKPSDVARKFYSQFSLDKLESRTKMVEQCARDSLREEYSRIQTQVESDAAKEEKFIVENLSNNGSGLEQETAKKMVGHSAIIEKLEGNPNIPETQKEILQTSYRQYNIERETLKILGIQGLETYEQRFKALLSTELPVYSHINRLKELSSIIAKAMKQ